MFWSRVDTRYDMKTDISYSIYHIFYWDKICGDTHFSTYMYNVGLVLKLIFRFFFCFFLLCVCYVT